MQTEPDLDTRGINIATNEGKIHVSPESGDQRVQVNVKDRGTWIGHYEVEAQNWEFLNQMLQEPASNLGQEAQGWQVTRE